MHAYKLLLTAYTGFTATLLTPTTTPLLVIKEENRGSET